MRNPLIVIALALLLAAVPAFAEGPEPLTLSKGQTIEASIGGAEETDAYTVDLPAESFIVGEANQLSVDVVVTIRNPSGDPVGNFDGPATGPEVFRFETEDAGAYTIEVTGFSGATGDYSITLTTSEPIATEPAERIDQLLTGYTGLDTPGGAICVMRDGAVVFQKAFGSANLSYDIPFSAQTRTNIGSTTKQFTCMAIMLLVEQGKLSVDDDVRTHIPELPEFSQPVTIRNLMTHTSGYREFLNAYALSGTRLDQGDFIDGEWILELVQRQPELQNLPGAEWNYNNTAYSLLTTIVERVTGEDYAEWVDANIFTPLEMHDSFVMTDRNTVIKNKAQGYVRSDTGAYLSAADLGASMGAGGIYTSIDDLTKWARNYRAHALGTDETWEQMTTPFQLTEDADGDPDTGYGFGLFIDEYRGLQRIHHGGADVAHRSMIAWYPEIDGVVITQSNNANFPGAMSNEVADLFFEDYFRDDEPEAEEDSVDDSSFDAESFDPESFDAMAGRYEMEEVEGFIITFTREDDQLFLQATGQPKFEIFPIGHEKFELRVVEAAVTFHRGDDGAYDTLTLHQGGDHPANRLADEPWAPTEEELGAFAGRYFSEELETFYTLSINDEGELVLSHRRFDDVTLTPSKENTFTGGFPVASAVFEIGDDGAPSALLVGNGRTRDVRFERSER